VLDPAERGRRRSNSARMVLEAAYLIGGTSWSSVFADRLAERLDWTKVETLMRLTT
jgi:hypothetical protein